MSKRPVRISYVRTRPSTQPARMASPVKHTLMTLSLASSSFWMASNVLELRVTAGMSRARSYVGQSPTDAPQVPNTHGGVVGAGDEQRALGVEGDAVDLVIVALELAHDAGRADIPEEHEFVGAA